MYNQTTIHTSSASVLVFSTRRAGGNVPIGMSYPVPTSLWREETSILVWHGFAINILIEVWMMVLISAYHSARSPPRSAQVIRCNYWLGKVAGDHPAVLTAVPVMSRAGLACNNLSDASLAHISHIPAETKFEMEDWNFLWHDFTF